MNTSVNHHRPRATWAWVVTACITTVLVAAGCFIWFGTEIGRGSETRASEGPSPTSSSQPSQDLDPSCAQRTNAPTNSTISVRDKSLEIAERKLDFEFHLEHDSKLNAVNVGFRVAFMKDGKDVTDQMDKKFREQWNVHGSVLPPGENFFGDYDVVAPNGWKDGEVDLEVTVGEPEYWCTPKENEEP